MIHRSRIVGAILGVLVLGLVLSACGAAPVMQTWPGLSVSGGMLYAISGSPQKVYILDATTGVQKGTFAPEATPSGVPYWSPVTVANDSAAVSTQGAPLAFVGYSDSTAKLSGLYAFDANTGQEQWNVPLQTASLIMGAPVYNSGTVYFGADDGKVYAVDVKSHSVKPGWPFQANDSIWAAPLFAGGKLYVASMGHQLYCLDGTTGAQIWSFQSKGAMAAQPELNAAGTTLYIGDFDANVYAIDAATGKAVSGFSFRASNWIWSDVLVTPDRLYVTSLDGSLYALDPATGTVIPSFPFTPQSPFTSVQSGRLRAAPVLAGDLVVIASDTGIVTAVNGTTVQRSWYFPTSAPTIGILTTPMFFSNTVYVILTNGQVYALQADNGVQRWAFASPTG